jgi:hypothetical protein
MSVRDQIRSWLLAPKGPLHREEPKVATKDEKKARRAELERQMKDKQSDYWKGEKAEGHQAEYRQLLDDESEEQRAGDQGGPDEQREREIQALMADRGSDYWKGPKSEGLQKEYRALVDRRMKGHATPRDIGGRPITSRPKSG